MTDWPFEIAERDHDIQNPLSREKIELLGEYMRLTRESRVLDVACGKAGPALVLAGRYGCRIFGIELRPGFADAARTRVAEAGLADLIEVQTADASEVALESESFDAALCLGASFVWGTLAETAAVLVAAVRGGGFVAIGEPFWHSPPPPEEVDHLGYVDLPATVQRFEAAGLALTGLIASSDDDWDRYRSLHWRAMEEWLEQRPADQIRAQHERRRDDYLQHGRALLGWAIFVGRKPVAD